MIFLLLFSLLNEVGGSAIAADKPALASVQNGELFSLLDRCSRSVPEKYRLDDSESYFMVRVSVVRAWDGTFDLGYLPIDVLDRGFPKIRLLKDIFWVVHDRVQVGSVIHGLRGFPLSEFSVIHVQNPLREQMAMERFNNRNWPCLTIDCRINWSVTPVGEFLRQTEFDERVRQSKAIFTGEPEPKPIVLREFYDVLPSSLSQCELYWLSNTEMSIYHGSYHPEQPEYRGRTKWDEKPARRFKVPFTEDFWATRSEGEVYFLTESGSLYRMSKNGSMTEPLATVWSGDKEPIRFAISDNHSGKVFAFTKPNKENRGKVLIGLSTKPIDFDWSKLDRKNGLDHPKLLYDLSRWLIDQGHLKVK
jgi:hypothetical protein